MSIMDLKGIKNNPKRNGFDLSERVAFTAKVGELLPIVTKEVLPGDKFKINIRAFSRTVPLNTAAYTTIREYYDVFFVPNRLLWNRFDQFITQMPNNQHSAGFNAIESGVIAQQPYFDFDEIIQALHGISTETSGEFSHNFFGYNKAKLSAKLLNYLGYGNIQHYLDHYRDEYPNNTDTTYNPAVNPFPLCAYQKIYQDFYRNNQWEESNPQSYNFDFVSQYTNKNLSAWSAYDTGMFDLRYANYKKDLFTGLMPNAQFSPTASFAYVASQNSTNSYRFVSNGSINNANANGGNLMMYNGMLQDASKTGPLKNIDGIQIYTDNIGRLSVLALRQAEALQKWNEISQANKYDYKHQLEAHWGVNVSNSRSGLCEYLGGTSSTLDIDGVDNTNITARDDNGTQVNKAVVAGKGIGANSGFVDFEAKEHGILMIIYHAIPELDYVNYGINPLNTKTKPTDYAIPELDSIGMQEVPLIQLINDERLMTGLTANGQPLYPMKSIGYAPRYYDYKTAVDTIKGAFIDTYSDWVAPMTRDYIYNYLKKTYDETLGSYLTYTFFKVNPNILFPIIGEEATDDVSTDHLLINGSFDVKVVRNLDYNGLPY